MRNLLASRYRYAIDFAIGLLLACSAIGIRLLLDPYLMNGQPFTPLHGITAAAAWFLNWRTAVVSAVVSEILASHLFVQPRGIWLPSSVEVVEVATYYLTAFLIVYLGYRAKKADTQKALFLATLAHEIRNPLAALSNATSFIRKRLVNDEALLHAVGIQERQVMQLTRMVEDLRDLTQISQGTLQVRKEDVDLRDCIGEAAQGAADLILAKDQRLNLELPHYPLPVHADPSRMIQGFANLLGNAAKYSPNAAEIKVLARCHGDKVTVAVCDRGVGMDRELLARIFDPYFVGNKTLSGQHGMGIGLWLTKQIVEMHGGFIEASSAGAGRGSQFIITLPAAAEQQASRLPPRPESC